MNVPASLWSRLAALVYDLFPLVALWMLVSALFLLAAHGNVDVAHPPGTYRLGLQTALLTMSATYFVVSWARGGQTIGMRPWRIRVVAVDGTALPYARAVLRFLVALVSLGACGLGFAWCLIDPQGRAWHDLAARSRVVRLRPN